MADEDPLIAELFKKGRFREASEALEKSRQGTGDGRGAPGRLVLVELLERTGRLPEAKLLLASLKKALQLTDSDRARYFLLEGLLSKQMGHLEDSIQSFERAYRLAERAGSSELLCWCQLRLVAVSADVGGAAFDPALLASLRTNVEKAAVPSVSINYHILLGEYHAKRGYLDASRHHSDLAESLLQSFPNLWLRGLLDLHQSCLSYLEGNYLDSLGAAVHALETSRESGHLLTGLIARADMAAAYLAVGQPARARACLSSALMESNREEQIYGLLLETLAEAQLVSGDLEGCSESLRSARDLTVQLSQSRSAWHKAWNLRTEARLLQLGGHWSESLALIQRAAPRDSPDSHSFTWAQVKALEALALARVGRSQEARAVIQRFVKDSLVAPKSYLCTVLAASVALSAGGSSEGEAVGRCANALRIVGATGEASGLIDIVDQFVQLAVAPPEEYDTPQRTEGTRPLWRPTNVACHLDSSSLVSSNSQSDVGGLERFLESVADAAMDPLSLGEEALRCLVSMGWIKSGSVERTYEEESQTVVGFQSPSYVQPPVGASLVETQDCVQVWLGSKQGRRYRLFVCPQEPHLTAARCYGFVRLLASLRRSQTGDSPQTKSAGGLWHPLESNESDELFQSPAMLALLASARRVAPLDITVLLTGESGTGKEVVARIIHRASGLPQDAFIAFNCSTVPREMVDSQLFGYRRGAFTGAVQGFKGVIGSVDGGTLLLDEIGELPLESQPKLLRFLDSGEVVSLGEATPRRLRVRVIAATNADLEKLVQEGRFREDLFYRLNVVRFRLPPLRERREEIGPFISMFLRKYTSEFGKHNIRLSEAAEEHLLLSAWPGNVRQLSHELRRLVALSESDSVIEVHDLDSHLRGQPEGLPPATTLGPHSVNVRLDRRLSEIIQEIEERVIADAIESTNGRMDLAAKRLGLSRKGLYLKRHRLGLLQ